MDSYSLSYLDNVTIIKYWNQIAMQNSMVHLEKETEGNARTRLQTTLGSNGLDYSVKVNL